MESQLRGQRALTLPWRALASATVDGLRGAGRMLPVSVRIRLAPLAFRIERAQSRLTGRDIVHPLNDFRPLRAAHEFDPRRIAMISVGLHLGGTERQLVSLMRALAERGCPPDLFCERLGEGDGSDFYLPAVAGYPGAVRSVVPFDDAQPVLQALRADQQQGLADVLQWLPAALRRLTLRFVAEFLISRPGVVHAWGDSSSVAAGYAARIVGVPRIIVAGRGQNPTNFGNVHPCMREAWRQLAACRTIRMINNSAAGVQDYAAWLGLPAERFEIHRNGVDPAAFSAASSDQVASLRRRLGIPAAAPVVGSLMRLAVEKQPMLWMKMASHVARRRADVHFVVFGSGPLAAKMRSFARAHGFGERMHLPGPIERVDLAFGLFDVLALTSRFEGTPNVLIEAAVLGVPVVTTAAGGAVECVEPGKTGIVAREWRGEAIAAQVLAILGDPAWSARVRAHGPRFVAEKFGQTRMVDEAMAFYGLSPSGAVVSTAAAMN